MSAVAEKVTPCTIVAVSRGLTSRLPQTKATVEGGYAFGIPCAVLLGLDALFLPAAPSTII